jgi:hypothetical protein
MKRSSRSIDPSPPLLTPAEAAWQAAEAIRALNHLTLAVTGPRAGYTDPSDVDTVLGALQALTERLPQTLGQASSWLTRHHERGRIGQDCLPPSHGTAPTQRRAGRHTRPGDELAPVAVPTLCSTLDTAAAVSGDLAGVLRDARAVSCHLTGLTP